MRAPLLAPVVSLASGIVLARSVELARGEAVAASVCLAGLAACAVWKRLGIRKIVLCLACAAAGSCLWTLHAPRRAPPLAVNGNDPQRVEGCVVEPPEFYPDHVRFPLELAPGARGRVTIGRPADPPLPGLAYGQRIALWVHVRTPHSFQNPGAFDFAEWLARQRIFWRLPAVRHRAIEILPGECGHPAMGAVYALRGYLIRRLDEIYPPQDPARGLLRALLIGDETALRQVWIDDFRHTGAYHALVISGTQIAILAGALIFFARFLNLSPGWSLLWTSLAAWVYALAAGFDPPVARAAAGCTLFGLGRWWHRSAQPLNSLFALVLLFLLHDPGALYDASFQLSFLAVAALAGLAAPIIENVIAPWMKAMRYLPDDHYDLKLDDARLSAFRVEMRLLAETVSFVASVPARWVQRALAALIRMALLLAALAVTSLVLQVALSLPMIVYFHRLSWSGFTANMLVVPLTSWAIPLGFLAVFTRIPWLGALAGWCARTSADIVAWHARWNADIRVPDPPLLLLVFCVAAFCATSWALFRRPRLAAPLGAGALACLMLIAAAPAPGGQTPELELTAIDVGQGDSLFLRFPNGATMLVDTGGLPARGGSSASRFDVGEEVVSPYLWQRRLRRLDYVAITHFHEDHAGGLRAVAANFRPSQIWTGRQPRGLKLDPAWNARALVRGDRFTFGPATLEVLWPPPDLPAPKRASNNDSLVMLVRYGRTSFLLTGDCEQVVDRTLLDEGLPVQADVLKVAHHGSRRATAPELLDWIKPSVAVVSAGFENIYGLPQRQLLDRLAARRILLFRTDRDGAVTIRSDGHHLSVGRAAPGPAVPSPVGDY